ncbi:MAG: hypothetical protein DMG57_00125 [Acidobacteria bacterium]|nr:MAG: hypothetical protein DMG57_00125 [Acidobacteriota bacterium]
MKCVVQVELNIVRPVTFRFRLGGRWATYTNPMPALFLNDAGSASRWPLCRLIPYLLRVLDRHRVGVLLSVFGGRLLCAVDFAVSAGPGLVGVQ